ncbi:unnamed protein product, partial [Musa acuminata var. zebrina]
MARMLILFCLLFPLVFESDSRKLLRNASAVATHEESMEKEECRGVGNGGSTTGGRWME